MKVLGLCVFSAVVLCNSGDDWHWEGLVSAKMPLSSALFLPQSHTAAGPAWSFPPAKSAQGDLCFSLAIHASFIYSEKS